MFVTYANWANPHVRVHREDCGHLRKHGGEHKYGQGEYKSHATLAEAFAHAEITGLPAKPCSFCKPETTQG